MSDSNINRNHQPETSFAQQWSTAWNEFWFRPSAAHTLALMRILTGLMVLYSHAVWTLEFNGFIGGGLLSLDYRKHLYQSAVESTFAWSHFDWLPTDLWMPVHILGLLAVVCYVAGWQTKFFSWITAALVISYANRTTGALFGLDQILALLTLYLAISSCGDAFSLGSWLASRKGRPHGTPPASPWNSIATRLIQIHLCVVYLFAGLGKCQGDTWWNGEAIWGALASYEYQTVDMTFMADQMGVVAVITLLTLFWEVSYAALIWPKLTRPIMLTLAIPMHLGIGICMGMMTFGLVMLIANLSFISPNWFTRNSSANPQVGQS